MIGDNRRSQGGGEQVVTSHTLLIMYVKTFGTKCAIIKDDLPTTFQYICPRGFRGEDF
jgi:hypothetical protein